MNPYQKPTIEQILHDHKKYIEWLENDPKQKYIDDVVSRVLAKQFDDLKKYGDEPVTTSTMSDNDKRKAETFTESEIGRIVEVKRAVEAIAKRIGHHGKMVIAGGCFASLINGEQIKDIDVFFLDMPSSDYLNLIKHLGTNVGNLVDKTDYVRDNDNIMSVWNAEGLDYQFIFTKYNTREELIAHFDYVHCMVSYANYNMYITRQTYDAIKNKHLIVNNNKQVKQWRTEKFKSRGWSIPGEALTQQQFDAMIRQPASAGGWQQAARINPMGRVNPYISAIDQKHIDKLLDDLEKNGQ